MLRRIKICFAMTFKSWGEKRTKSMALATKQHICKVPIAIGTIFIVLISPRSESFRNRPTFLRKVIKYKKNKLMSPLTEMKLVMINK